MLLQDVGALMATQGYITVTEPACGSGCMFIEVANALHAQGYSPQQVMLVHATDRSRVCFNMTSLQLSVLNIPGLVVYGDSLSQEVWECRPTPGLMAMSKRSLSAVSRVPGSA